MSRYRLVCFDVDGTLVDNVVYSWDLFHDYFKTDKAKRAESREKFFAGQISYKEWALHDIEQWKKKGANKKSLVDAIKHLSLMEGALDAINELQKQGMKLAIVSGSISIIPETLVPNFNSLFSHVYLNKLVFDGYGNIKDVIITDFDIDGKAEALKIIAEKEKISLKECVFIGDHHNDVRIVQTAGLGIAFNCKSDELRKVADVVIEKKDLREVLRYII